MLCYVEGYELSKILNTMKQVQIGLLKEVITHHAKYSRFSGGADFNAYYYLSTVPKIVEFMAFTGDHFKYVCDCKPTYRHLHYRAYFEINGVRVTLRSVKKFLRKLESFSCWYVTEGVSGKGKVRV